MEGGEATAAIRGRRRSNLRRIRESGLVVEVKIFLRDE